ncbi:MAG: mannonate dehydratase [Marinoscillum sp.]
MNLMEQTMRWYGPNDPVRLADIRQAGCTGVVTALHHIPVGEVWGISEVAKRKKEIEAAGMTWKVIESLPVHEDIKKRSGNYQKFIGNYQESIRNVASCGLKVITYNFMPILDWVRTDPAHQLPNGAKTLRFEKSAFIAFDLFLLKRPNAEKDYSESDLKKAKEKFDGMNDSERQTLFQNILLGLPGSDEAFTAEGVLKALKTYQGIDRDQLKQNLFAFLTAIVPVAEKAGVKLAIHPDDPPYSVLGLPRIVSNEKDLKEIVDAVPSASNGLCYCTGSLGVGAENDLQGILQRLGGHVHFLHLRSTKRDSEGNFEEADHMEGDADLPTIVEEVLKLMQNRNESIPMRPDHGHQMLDDLSKKTYPGYTAIGRLKALAEIRGLELGLSRSLVH